jgi:hypothetical protein
LPTIIRTVLAAAIGFAAGPAFADDGLEQIHALFVGTWANVEEPWNTWRHEADGSVHAYADGVFSGSGAWSVARACPGGEPAGTEAVMLYSDEYEPEPTCYAILEISGTTHSLRDMQIDQVSHYSRVESD